jgi:RsiW-degrading membrane proteinase PrsW (M82 family)
VALAIAITLALLPSVLILRYFLKHDAFPEPRDSIAKTFAWGVASIVPAVILAMILILLLSGVSADDTTGAIVRAAILAFFGAAIPEELFKFAVLFFYCRRLNDFDEPMDGIVYGVTVSLGFATLENVLYVFNGGIGLAIIRGFTAVPGHALFGVIMGFYFGLAHFGPRNRKLLWTAYLLPVLFHGLYNMPLMALQSDVSDVSAFWVLLSILVLVVGLITARRLHRRVRSAQAPRAAEA